MTPRSIIAAATAGEWQASSHGAMRDGSDNPEWFVSGVPGGLITHRTKADAIFIAAARTGWPEALDRVEALERQLEEREADMHMRIRLGYDKTVADAWRAENERLTAELRLLKLTPRDAVEMSRDDLDQTIADARRVLDERDTALSRIALLERLLGEACALGVKFSSGGNVTAQDVNRITAITREAASE
jgi:hypothetical protein